MNSTSVTIDTLPSQLRVWSEPGLDDMPTSLSLVKPEGAGDDLTEAMRVLAPDLTPREVDISLSGMTTLEGPPADTLLSAHVTLPSESVSLPSQPPPSVMSPVYVEPGPPVASVPPPATAEREWLWYLAALVILALGVVGYFWR